ncbi:ATP-dependent Clp protease proteolytic subunit [Salipiger sp. H15]|uniref:ATP-dependent Clp protease proteolytic subunit n=1 Tax=Alloyangia sp. H15 TaxID=3029062 RepID=A0AAU8AFJ1_9RHOB
MKASDLIVAGELILSGPVLLDEYASWMYEEEVFFCPRMVREALQELGEGRVTVRLNSDGGHVWGGEQVRAILAGHPGGTDIVVEGLAASSASLIFMAGTSRRMSSGSQLMIHDPSGYAWGTEKELRKAADDLDRAANLYASVYASASGKSPEEVREIMKAETWYSPEEAVAEGFADSIDGASTDDRVPVAAYATMEAALEAYTLSAKSFRAMHVRKREGYLPPNNSTAARSEPDGGTSAISANPSEMEIIMTKPNPAAHAVTPTTPAVEPAPVMTAPDVVAAERARARGIREMSAAFVASGRLAQADVDTLIDDGTSVADASARFMSIMAAAEPVGRSSSPTAQITRDETEARREGLVQAMMRNYEGPGAQFRGMRLRGLAMELSGAGRSYSDTESIRLGMRATTMLGGALGVSDFAYITTEVMNRSLIAEYARRGANWQVVTGAPMTAADFRELHAVRFGGDFQLKTVKENGEYQEATLNDQAEGLKVERRGRTINLTFEAVVNDDMGAFDRIPREFAMAARVMESSMVWSLIRTNAVLKSDNVALFHATHKNLAGSAGAISVTTVGAGRKALWEQTAFGSKDKDDFLQVEPNLLIVPPALEVDALQFATATTPARDGDINPYKGTLRPITVPNIGAAAGGSDTAWYLVSEDLPPISVAYLEGYEAPTVQTIEGMNPDKVTMNARHIFGAAASEFRGAYKNAGA